MKNKILFLALVFTFSSCSIFQKTQTVSHRIEAPTSEPEYSLQKFLGNYDIAVFGLPDGSDLKINMNVSKDGDGLKTVFTTDEANQGFDILRTEVEEDILYIDIFVKEYGINTAFEIYVEGNQVTGYLADMFELEGTKSD